MNSRSNQTGESHPATRVVGRGTGWNKSGRFESIQLEPDFEHLDESQIEASPAKVATQYFIDHAQSVVSENDSPDLKFRFSINPYRGCAHGCSYCYARPYHEFLGLSAGLDFESKIFVKPEAPQLFQKWLARRNWKCEPVNLSGITDPYQPAERKFEITRGILQVALDCQQPLFVITKNAMITRDVDLFSELAKQDLVRAIISITTLDQNLTRTMEPRTSAPDARLATIGQLAEHGIDVLVNIAPIIPGLTDSEVPEILRRAAAAGAKAASYTILRLPGAVEPIFLQWLDEYQPLKRAKIEAGIKSARGGRLSDSSFFERMKGSGVIAEHIRQTVKTFARKYGLDTQLSPLDVTRFVPPELDCRQRRLFD